MEKAYKQGLEGLILDARPKGKFKGGHIPGARNMEFKNALQGVLTGDQETAYRSLLGPDLNREIIIYGDDLE